MAQAHYGLAVLYALRSDERMASRHTLRSFVADARQARLELAPELYERMFSPQCVDIFSWHTSEANRIAQDNLASKILMKQIAAGGLAVVGAGAAIATAVVSRSLNVLHGAVGAIKMADEMWGEATQEHYRHAALQALDADRELRLDAKCVELALRALAHV